MQAKARTTGIGNEEIDAIYEEKRHITRLKLPTCKTLFYLESLCGKDRKVKMVSRANKLFEKNLDIRSLI